jgi:RNA polymerase sigma-70 factor (ECF subfamily)
MPSGAASMIDARFEAFVRRYQDMVFATAVRLLGNEADAEDVAQTVFLRAFQRFGQIESSPAAAGWLKAVARNTCLNHLSRYRARLRFFSELGSEGERTGEGFEASLSSEIARPLDDRHRQEQLEAALRALPDHQRVPLVLFHFEELSYQEIASALGITLAKAKTDIHRGRNALRTLIAGDHAAR